MMGDMPQLRTDRRLVKARRRRGAMVVLVAALLPVLLLVAGFAVDLANMQFVRSQLRATTDLAVKATAAALSTSGDVASARAIGKAVAAENEVAGQPLLLQDSDFEFGSATQQSGGNWAFAAGGYPLNAVRLNGRRTSGSLSGPVGLFFGSLFGAAAFEPQVTATASFVDVDICLVLDRSSSMKLAVEDTAGGMSGGDPRECETPWSDSRWVALESAVQTFISRMNASIAHEQVAVVTFASDNETCDSEVDEASVDQDLTLTLSQINSAMAARSSSIWNGMTNIDSGIEKGHEVLTGSQARATALKVMIVLTDGVYTGNYPVPYAEDAYDDDIVVHTITFSAGANQTDMQAVAAAAGGSHYHAPDATTLDNVFDVLAGSISILTE